uniref:Uncharacterized protein n=1 Tax=Romanomermis culicivorax TaxID=13658 RepID=A0A915LBJ9_ROMCU
MLSGLAEKLFGTITSTTSNAYKMEDSVDEKEVVVATASQDQEELSDSEEWVLLDDDGKRKGLGSRSAN